MTNVVSTDQHFLTTRDPDDPTTFSWLYLLDITRLWQQQISIDQELPNSEVTRDVSTSYDILHFRISIPHFVLLHCRCTYQSRHQSSNLINTSEFPRHTLLESRRLIHELFIIYRIISYWIFVYSSYSSRVCIINMFWIFEHYDTRFLFTSCKECTRTQSWYHELSSSF